jgi:chaperonin cofactor prefoldin
MNLMMILKVKKEELDKKSKELDPNSTLNKSWLDKLKEKINTMGRSSGNANTNNSTSSRGERTGWSKWFGGDNIDYKTNVKYGSITTKLKDRINKLSVRNININSNQKIVAKKVSTTSNQKVINNNFSDRKIISNTNIITYGETVI